MILHYSMYNYSELDQSTEWDLSGNKDGVKNSFPSVLLYTDKNTLGPPASYEYIGRSKLTTPSIGNITAPYTISFWIKPLVIDYFEGNPPSTLPTNPNGDSLEYVSTLFQTSSTNSLKIELNHYTMKMGISGTTHDFVLSNSKFNFVVITVSEESLKISINGSTLEPLPIAKKNIGGVITLLEYYVGLFADFKIYSKLLTQKEIGILHKTIISIGANSVNSYSITTTKNFSDLTIDNRNTIGKNKTYNLEGLYEYSSDNTGDNVVPEGGALSFNLTNSSTIENFTVNNVAIITKYSNDMSSLNTLYALQLQIKSNEVINNLEFSVNSRVSLFKYQIQTVVYPIILANTDTTLFLIFKTYNMPISDIELNFKTPINKVEVKNVKIFNLTNSKIENYLFEKKLNPTLSDSGFYTTPSGLVGWGTTNIRNNSSGVIEIPAIDNPFSKLFSDNKHSGFAKINKRVGVISKNINEFSAHL